MDLHINYEDAEPYNLTRKDETPKTKKEKTVSDIDKNAGLTPKVKLKADKITNKIFIDSVTTLSRVPKLAWEYKLGNRTALEWVLEYHKEKKPKDETIREKFNNYKFADYKEEVIELLQKVTTVSIKTMEIVNKMEKESE